jgi:recombination associated protein RdgC
MFKNITAFRIDQKLQPDFENLESALGANQFLPCGLTQEKSVGWSAPRCEGGAMVEFVDGQWILKLLIETKSVPAEAVNKLVDEQCKKIEATTGRRPGKREKRDMKDDALLTLLPHAFAKQTAVLVWISPIARLVVIDSVNNNHTNDVLTCLVKAVQGFTAMSLLTANSPSELMSDCLLTQEPPPGFRIDRECELKSSDDSKAIVLYSNHALDIEEVQEHIKAGKRPTRLAMTWDSRVSFILADTLQIKKLCFLEGVIKAGLDNDDDRFNSDVAIATGELSIFIPDLLYALGGEV